MANIPTWSNIKNYGNTRGDYGSQDYIRMAMEQFMGAVNTVNEQAINKQDAITRNILNSVSNEIDALNTPEAYKAAAGKFTEQALRERVNDPDIDLGPLQKQFNARLGQIYNETNAKTAFDEGRQDLADRPIISNVTADILKQDLTPALMPNFTRIIQESGASPKAQDQLLRYLDKQYNEDLERARLAELQKDNLLTNASSRAANASSRAANAAQQNVANQQLLDRQALEKDYLNYQNQFEQYINTNKQKGAYLAKQISANPNRFSFFNGLDEKHNLIPINIVSLTDKQLTNLMGTPVNETNRDLLVEKGLQRQKRQFNLILKDLDKQGLLVEPPNPKSSSAVNVGSLATAAQGVTGNVTSPRDKAIQELLASQQAQTESAIEEKLAKLQQARTLEIDLRNRNNPYYSQLDGKGLDAVMPLMLQIIKENSSLGKEADEVGDISEFTGVTNKIRTLLGNSGKTDPVTGKTVNYSPAAVMQAFQSSFKGPDGMWFFNTDATANETIFDTNLEQALLEQARLMALDKAYNERVVELTEKQRAAKNNPAGRK